jgi:hypothetical protein
MSKKPPQLNPLVSRKEVLVVESERNRAQMIEDVDALSADIHALADRAKSFDAIASSAAVLVSGLSAFQRAKFTDGDAKPSWLRSIVKGAGLVSNLWLAFRPKSRHQNGS